MPVSASEFDAMATILKDAFNQIASELKVEIADFEAEGGQSGHAAAKDTYAALAKIAESAVKASAEARAIRQFTAQRRTII